MVELPGWRNWQTRYIQGVVSVRTCRFDSCSGHPETRYDGEERSSPSFFFSHTFCCAVRPFTTTETSLSVRGGVVLMFFVA